MLNFVYLGIILQLFNFEMRFNKTLNFIINIKLFQYSSC